MTESGWSNCMMSQSRPYGTYSVLTQLNSSTTCSPMAEFVRFSDIYLEWICHDRLASRVICEHAVLDISIAFEKQRVAGIQTAVVADCVQ